VGKLSNNHDPQVNHAKNKGNLNQRLLILTYFR